MSVRHLNSRPDMNLGMHSSFIGEEDSELVCPAFSSCPSAVMLGVEHISLSLVVHTCC